MRGHGLVSQSQPIVPLETSDLGRATRNGTPSRGNLSVQPVDTRGGSAGLAPASDNTDNISSKSGFMIEASERPRLEREPPNHSDSLARLQPKQFVRLFRAETELSCGVARSIGHDDAWAAEAVVTIKDNTAICVG